MRSARAGLLLAVVSAFLGCGHGNLLASGSESTNGATTTSGAGEVKLPVVRAHKLSPGNPLPEEEFEKVLKTATDLFAKTAWARAGNSDIGEVVESPESMNEAKLSMLAAQGKLGSENASRVVGEESLIMKQYNKEMIKYQKEMDLFGIPRTLDNYNFSVVDPGCTNNTAALEKFMEHQTAKLANQKLAHWTEESKEKAAARAVVTNQIKGNATMKEQKVKAEEAAMKAHEKGEKWARGQELGHQKADLIAEQETHDAFVQKELAEKGKEFSMKDSEKNTKLAVKEKFDSDQAAERKMKKYKDRNRQLALAGSDFRTKDVLQREDQAIEDENRAEYMLNIGMQGFAKVTAGILEQKEVIDKSYVKLNAKWELLIPTDKAKKELAKSTREDMCDLRKHISAVNRVEHAANVVNDRAAIHARDRAMTRGMDGMEDLFGAWHDREKKGKMNTREAHPCKHICMCVDTNDASKLVKQEFGGDETITAEEIRAACMFNDEATPRKSGPSACAVQMLIDKHNPWSADVAEPTVDQSLRDCKEDTRWRAEQYWHSHEKYEKFSDRLLETRASWKERVKKELRIKEQQKRERGRKAEEVVQKKSTFAQETLTYFHDEQDALQRTQNFLQDLQKVLKDNLRVDTADLTQLKGKTEKFMPKYHKEQKAKHNEKQAKEALNHQEHHVGLHLTLQGVRHEAQFKAVKVIENNKIAAQIAAQKEAATVEIATKKNATEFNAEKVRLQSELDTKMQALAVEIKEAHEVEEKRLSTMSAVREEKRVKKAEIDDKIQKESNTKGHADMQKFTAPQTEYFHGRMQILKSEQAAIAKTCVYLRGVEQKSYNGAKLRKKEFYADIAQTVQDAIAGKVTKGEGEMKAVGWDKLAVEIAPLADEAKKDLDKYIDCKVKLRNNIAAQVDLKHNFTAILSSRGCDWLACDSSACGKSCENGFYMTSTPGKILDGPGNGACECKCQCHPLTGLVHPHDMKWIEPAKEKRFQSLSKDYDATVKGRNAFCAAPVNQGSFITGCTKCFNCTSRPVDLQCGCKKDFFISAFEISMEFPKFRSTDETIFASGFWRLAVFPNATTRQKILDYMKWCVMQGPPLVEKVEGQCNVPRVSIVQIQGEKVPPPTNMTFAQQQIVEEDEHQPEIYAPAGDVSPTDPDITDPDVDNTTAPALPAMATGSGTAPLPLAATPAATPAPTEATAPGTGSAPVAIPPEPATPAPTAIETSLEDVAAGADPAAKPAATPAPNPAAPNPAVKPAAGRKLLTEAAAPAAEPAPVDEALVKKNMVKPKSAGVDKFEVLGLGSKDDDVKIEKHDLESAEYQAPLTANEREKEAKQRMKTMVKDVKTANQGYKSLSLAKLGDDVDKLKARWQKEGMLNPFLLPYMHASHERETLTWPTLPKNVSQFYQALVEHQKCYQKYQFVWSMCGKINPGAPPITVYCRTETNGEIHEIKDLGCGCKDNVHVKASLTGIMAMPRQPLKCAAPFLKWSLEAQDMYMNTAPYRSCAMQLARQCNMQDGIVKERKLKKLTRDKKNQERKHKPLYKMIKLYDKSLAEEEKKITKLRLIQSNSVYNYVNIPHLKLEGKEFTNTPHMSACRRQCDRSGQCRSYAFDQRTKGCFWSSKQLDYQEGWTMYLKQRGNGRTHKEFFPIVGLKGEENSQVDFTGVRTIGECKFNCFTDESCNAFAYNTEKGDCIGMSSGLSYNPDYQYYEKRVGTDEGLDAGVEGGRPYEKAEMEGRFAVEKQDKGLLKAQFDHIMKLEADERSAKSTPSPTPWAELGEARPAHTTDHELLPNTPGWTTIPLPKGGKN